MYKWCGYVKNEYTLTWYDVNVTTVQIIQCCHVAKKKFTKELHCKRLTSGIFT